MLTVSLKVGAELCSVFADMQENCLLISLKNCRPHQLILKVSK